MKRVNQILTIMALGGCMSAWAASTPASITVTYEKPYIVKADNSVQVMNAYHLGSPEVSKLSTSDVQAIKSTCGSSSNVQLISKNIVDRQILFCASNNKALNIPTGDVVMSSCGGPGCP